MAHVNLVTALIYRSVVPKLTYLLPKYTEENMIFMLCLLQAISASGTKKNELILGELQSQLKNKNISFDVKATSDSKVSCSYVELQYLHDYAGVTAAVGLTANPIVNLSGVVGTNVYSVGADVSFDTATGNFIKCNGGLSVINADLIASLTV
ncbi:hypothetical protein GW17_00056254 [Ensete ventricosum]|nr:hypothetical protein GW17_00056254 [Ensete ventricosum]RZR84642.1 hypothetical protein BHM03_00011497 [Ensete ventricosum]